MVSIVHLAAQCKLVGRRTQTAATSRQCLDVTVERIVLNLSIGRGTCKQMRCCLSAAQEGCWQEMFLCSGSQCNKL